MSTTLAVPAIAIQKQVMFVGQSVQSLVIKTADDYRAAGELSRTIAALRKEIDATFDPIISKAYATHKESCNMKRKYALPLEIDQKTVDQKLLAWSAEQEKLRRQQEEELARQAKVEQEEQAIREAEELHKQGEGQLADIVLDAAASAPAPVVALPSMVPKVEGLASRKVWRWRVKNAALIPREFLCADEVKIGGVVRAMKSAANIPGIEIYSEDSAIHR